MAIEQDEIEKIAELARIRIAPDQIGQVTQRITEILHMVDQLQAVDTSNVEPMANPLDATQRLRPDAVTESNQRDAFQAIQTASPGLKRRFIRQFVDRIELDPCVKKGVAWVWRLPQLVLDSLGLSVSHIAGAGLEPATFYEAGPVKG